MPYTAPEVLHPSGNALPFTQSGPPLDCWAFGITALQLLTGCCLFKIKNSVRPSDILPGTRECHIWERTYTADLHKEWVCISFFFFFFFFFWVEEKGFTSTRPCRDKPGLAKRDGPGEVTSSASLSNLLHSRL